jgi:acetoin utilization protein AcuB
MMIVSHVMTRNPIVTHPDTPVTDVRSLMEKEKIGHVPVLDRNNNLAGIVTRQDLIKAGPSMATSLDMYEISYLLSRIRVSEIMEKNVLTVNENEVVEEAARIMADRGIGCLPVMKGFLLVGIITDTDLFHFFINAFGARHEGVRITFNMTEKPGQLARIAGAIAELGGNIVAFVSSEGDDLAHRRGTLKIEGLTRSEVEQAVRDMSDFQMEDVR